MPALNACLKVAKIAEASGAPYLENVAKVAVVVFELLKEKGKNKKDAEELCQSIADTIVVIDDLVRNASSYIDICREMEGYLQCMAQDIKDFKLRYRGLRGVFCVDDFRDAIQAYRRHADNLNRDFMMHVVLDSNSKVTQIHYLLMNEKPQAVVHHSNSAEFVFRIPKNLLQSLPFFFFSFSLI
ncbi:hypothetical protein F5146DRAFT_1228255 [Armillaria mellea]|nr:hypothetical protein F5146DRAFT_1228255 [Armillaria mellea]